MSHALLLGSSSPCPCSRSAALHAALRRPGSAPSPTAGGRASRSPPRRKVRAPYDVRSSARAATPLADLRVHRDRFYVHGNAGERYTIRITNPTASRIEAVVSVDGLDVIDGESGDLRKRGYVVPPYGEIRIEGFRTSTADVATFRFSSVNDSYAGKKGKARNVGVIAVALFEEQAARRRSSSTEPAPPTHRLRRRTTTATTSTSDLDRRGGRGAARGGRPSRWRGRAPRRRRQGAGQAPAPSAPPADRAPSRAGGGAPPPAPAAPPPSAHADMARPRRARRDTAPTSRRGTQRAEASASASAPSSASSATRPRASPVRARRATARSRSPSSATTTPPASWRSASRSRRCPTRGEIMTRETADPFPGDDRFARPPGR